MKFSIVIPTYNEEQDIGGTLDALMALDHPDFEIVVVDDSTDRTPEIVRTYASRDVHLIRPEIREGRCGARNLGILSAAGDVVVILNADVRPQPDFLRRIQQYYEAGYDYVLVKSEVLNRQDLYARYVAAMADSIEVGADPSWMEWTEGFSCRKSLAIQAGLFPVGFAVPICAGEDGVFGTNLQRLGARKKIDFSIVVPHIAPGHLAEYWQIRKGRGKGSPQIRRFLQGWHFWQITGWASVRLLKNLAAVLTLLPMVFTVMSAVRYSKNGMRDFFPFIWAWIVEQTAFHVGEWQSIVEIRRAEHRLRTQSQPG